MNGDAQYNLHTPWLVDDDYFRSGFAYTRLQEQDFAELYLNVGNKYVTGTVAFMASLFSDWARPLLENQLGIAQAYLTFHWDADIRTSKLKLQLKAGSFWDRFGWLESYDTYLFGRTHQLGAQARIELDAGRLTLYGLYGFGAHLEAIDVNQGLTLLNYVNLGANWNQQANLGFYYLDSTTHDKRQLSEITDADMSVVGTDGWLKTPLLGRFYLGLSYVNATHAKYLSPAIEVMHSYGGRGITENFLGTEKSENGTGWLFNVAFEHSYSLRAVLHRYAPERLAFLHGGDISLRWFGLYTNVASKQLDADPLINKDGREYFKWGIEPAVHALSWLLLSLRYDRVISDLNDNANSFRILTPRITFTTHYWVNAQIYLQYSRYSYGARALLRPGQVALETMPDTDVFKLQAQMVF